MASLPRPVLRPKNAQQLVLNFRRRALRPHTFVDNAQAAPDAAASTPPSDASKSTKKTPGHQRVNYSVHTPAASGSPSYATAYNPFMPTRAPGVKGHWVAPKISLRRQAQLVKAAKSVGLAHLLPPGPKMRVQPKPPATFYEQYDKVQAERLQKEATRAQREVEVVALAESQANAKAQKAAAADVQAAWFGAEANAAKVTAKAGRGPAKQKKAATSKVTKSQPGAKQVDPIYWKMRVQWLGDAPSPKKPHASRLYAARRRMFKGHKWERVRDRVIGRRRVLMRDMAKRIRRYKGHYARRRPNPLKPSTSAKAAKLPF